MKLQGIYVPLVTPFTTDDQIDYPVLEQLAEVMIAKVDYKKKNIEKTDENYSFSAEERNEILQRIAVVAKLWV